MLVPFGHLINLHGPHGVDQVVGVSSSYYLGVGRVILPLRHLVVVKIPQQFGTVLAGVGVGVYPCHNVVRDLTRVLPFAISS